MTRDGSPEQIEKQMASEFHRMEFVVERQFQIEKANLDGSTARILLDFYISSPLRCVVEVKHGPPNERTLEDMLRIRKKFFAEAVVLILAIRHSHLGKVKQLLQDRPIHVISFMQDDPNAGKKLARNIGDAIFQQLLPNHIKWNENPTLIANLKMQMRKAKHPRAQGSRRTKPLLGFMTTGPVQSSPKKGAPSKNMGELGKLLPSLKCFMEEDAYETLEGEFHQFHAEYENGHYTTGALRIGRIQEFCVYSLAKAVNVNINESSLSFFKKLDDAFKRVKKSVIDYVNIADEHDKESLQKKMADAQAQLTKLLAGMHFSGTLDEDAHREKDKPQPISVYAIMSDIKKKYKKNETIRNEVDTILAKKGPFQKLMKLRNHAAHADTSGQPREVTKEDFEDMQRNLRIVLQHMCNIASTPLYESETK
jgi:hypothetical protein